MKSRFVADPGEYEVVSKANKEAAKKKKKLIPLTKSTRFSKFVASRDKGLELVLAKYSHSIGDVVTVLQKRSEEIASRMLIKPSGHNALKANRDSFEHQLRPIYKAAAERIAGLIMNLRRTTFVLTAASQDYVIARVLGVATKTATATKYINAQYSKEMQLGGSVDARVDLAVSRLLRDVVDAYQMNQVMGGPPEECLARVARAFPLKRTQRRPPKVMARLTESGVKLSVGGRDPWDDFFSPEEWAEAVQDYTDEFIPVDRGPNGRMFYVDPDESGQGEFVRYQWQIEQEMTDDFIDSVRDGENDAANAQGIETFQWIAIVDGKTDDCCFDRDGLTVEEIEDGLSSGDIDADTCDATSAPAHFNCRCRMAPVVKDFPEESGPDWGSFDSWLDDKSS